MLGCKRAACIRHGFADRREPALTAKRTVTASLEFLVILECIVSTMTRLSSKSSRRPRSFGRDCFDGLHA